MVSRCASGRPLVWVGRGVLLARHHADDGRNGGIKTRSEPGRCPLAWLALSDQWRAATPSQTDSLCTDPLFASEDPFCLSPEDDRPCEEDPLCLSPEADLRPPARERTCFQMLAKPSPCVSPPKAFGGEQEGSCDAGMMRFPHRWTDPRCAAEHRAPAGPPPILGPQSYRKARTQQSQTRRGPSDPRSRRRRSRYRSEAQR